MARTPIHVVHLVYRFAAGGLENVVAQLVNHLPAERFRHTVVALTEVDAKFSLRITRPDVELIALHKPPGQPFRLYPAMYRLLRRLRPDVLHTCNLAPLEFAPVAALAGVPLRVHAEHGWELSDQGGSNTHHRLLRRFYRPFVDQFIAVSTQINDYLRDAVGVKPDRLHLIPNGVDTRQFHPVDAAWQAPADYPFHRPEHWVIGTVGRLQAIKNQTLLAEAFVNLVRRGPPGSDRLRLAIVGEGPLAQPIRDCLSAAGMLDRLWLPGARSDIADLLRAFDCFVLPSLSEGTSCTLQEAMATGLPIVATDVGGNSALLEDGRCGQLTESGDADSLSRALESALSSGPFWAQRIDAAQARIATHYSLDSIVSQYSQIFGAI